MYDDSVPEGSAAYDAVRDLLVACEQRLGPLRWNGKLHLVSHALGATRPWGGLELHPDLVSTLAHPRSDTADERADFYAAVVTVLHEGAHLAAPTAEKLQSLAQLETWQRNGSMVLEEGVAEAWALDEVGDILAEQGHPPADPQGLAGGYPQAAAAVAALASRAATDRSTDVRTVLRHWARSPDAATVVRTLAPTATPDLVQTAGHDLERALAQLWAPEASGAATDPAAGVLDWLARSGLPRVRARSALRNGSAVAEPRPARSAAQHGGGQRRAEINR